MPKTPKKRKGKDNFQSRLQKVYYDPKHPTSFGGVNAIEKAVNEDTSKKILRQSTTFTLHKPPRVHFRRNRVIVGGIDEQWQADLVDLSSISKYNEENNFLLTCIEIFSKYAWAVPIKRKTGTNLIEAFGTILKTERKKREEETF